MHESAEPVATRSPPVFRPHIIQGSSQWMDKQEQSDVDRLVKEYTAARERGAQTVELEGRLMRAVASVLRDKKESSPTSLLSPSSLPPSLPSPSPLPPSTSPPSSLSSSTWLRLLGGTDMECSSVEREAPTIRDLVMMTEQQIDDVCRSVGVSSSLRLSLLRWTSRLRRLVQPEARSVEVANKQLAWSVPSPTELPSSSPSRVLSSRHNSSSPSNTSESLSPMAKVAFAKPSSSRSDSSTPCVDPSLPSPSALSSSSSLCPPSPLNLTTTTATVTTSPALSSVPRGRQRVVQSTSMHFVTGSKQQRIHHEIPHQWTKKNTFRFSEHTCALCRRQLGFGFLNTWEKCKSCKLKVHTHCKGRMGDTCGLTFDHLRSFLDDMVQQGNSDAWGMGPQSANVMNRSQGESAFQYPEYPVVVDSSSSTNSSAPSTPALANGTQPSPYAHIGCRSAMVTDSKAKFFTFSDCLPEVPDITIHDTNSEEQSVYEGETVEGPSEGAKDNIPLTASQDSETTIKGNDEGLAVVDSQGSTGDVSAAAELSPGGHTWDRTKWNMSTIRGASGQNSWSDVTIPYANIQLRGIIGKGQFGDVYRGYYYGDVAVKFLKMDHVDDERKIEYFKEEVAHYKNTRHDNIVLCIGYCFDHSNLGIIMGLCKGRTLHSILHDPNAEKVDLQTCIKYATEICQGVSYLHQKKILHKDLRSKNIFIESKQRPVITDFGLFSMKRLQYPKRGQSLWVSPYWLSYLAPEIIREIGADVHDLPFSEASDVFAFGTIWYELLTSLIPFSSLHPHHIIYSVGSGICAPLPKVSDMHEVKEIVKRSWSFSPTDRPSFQAILSLLQNLPKKRVDRSPSYPMVRSYESIF